MSMYSSDVANTSYTAKDFQTIYPELLDLVTKISPKWNPELSDESDPGVILLKLAAIIGDKNNYNIDKQILECFPQSVTQEANARKLYDQLGYNMHWYQSATGKVEFQFIGDWEGLTSNITIPKFTKITNAEN